LTDVTKKAVAVVDVKEAASKAAASMEELLLKKPLYTVVSTSADGCKIMTRAILAFGGTVDTYCPGCRKHSTLNPLIEDMVAQNLSSEPHGYRPDWDYPIFVKSLQCTRAGHFFHTHFAKYDNVLMKVGQYPSLADIQKPETEKFAKILGEERRKELNRAIGLAANGVGVGSYVYLRRIFESFIEEAHQTTSGSADWDEDAYVKSRMAERIKMLRAHLPSFLVENPKLYSILSLGVHELKEQQCLANFDALLLCINVILEERLEDQAKRERAEAAKKALAKFDPQTAA